MGRPDLIIKFLPPSLARGGVDYLWLMPPTYPPTHTNKPPTQMRQANAAFHLEAERRWCLTGTPIVNKLDDLFSLVKCVD
jgi:hypothetical protein